MNWVRKYIHLSETKGEVENIKKQYGKSPIAWFDELGLFDTGCLAAHCVWVDDDDLDIMARKHVRVAHNPGSNLKLASGFAPIHKMLDKGIVVGLGTDGASSNNNLDIMEEMRLAVLVHKANTLDPLVIPAETVSVFSALRTSSLPTVKSAAATAASTVAVTGTFTFTDFPSASTVTSTPLATLISISGTSW